MKKDSSILRLFPLYFFMFFTILFLTIFISFKFVFIFFFRAAFEPQFIFELTPYYVLKGVNNLQLLFLSFIVILFSTYFHLKATRRNLVYSFLPTATMLCGLGLSIATKEITTSNLYHYLVFGCLLFILLIDHRHTLTLSETLVTPNKKIVETKTTKTTPVTVITKARSKSVQVSMRHRPSRLSFSLISSLFTLFKKSKKTTGQQTSELKDKTSKQPKIVSSKVETINIIADSNIDEKLTMYDGKPPEPKDSSDGDFKRVKAVLEELEVKAKKLEQLEDEIGQRRRTLVKQEKMFEDRLVTFSHRKNHYSLSAELKNKVVSDDEIDDEVNEYHERPDKIQECTAVIQRGILKQINSSFAELLGYKIEELVGKSLFVFVVPEGFAEIKKHYLNRLKGGSSFSYRTMFLTKDNNKIVVEIITRPTTFNGEKAEIAVIVEMHNQQGDADVSIRDHEDKQEDTSVTSEVEEMQEDTTIEQTEDVQEKITGEEEKTQDTTTEKVDDKPDNAASGEAKKSQEEIDAMTEGMKDKQK